MKQYTIACNGCGESVTAENSHVADLVKLLTEQRWTISNTDDRCGSCLDYYTPPQPLPPIVHEIHVRHDRDADSPEPWVCSCGVNGLETPETHLAENQ